MIKPKTDANFRIEPDGNIRVKDLNACTEDQREYFFKQLQERLQKKARIAKSCGFVEVMNDLLSGYRIIAGQKRLRSIPDYLNDLNAMALAVASLPRLTRGIYAKHLDRIVAQFNDSASDDECIQTCEATASMRADAFLLAMEEEG